MLRGPLAMLVDPICWGGIGMISDAQGTIVKPASDAARDHGQGGRPLAEERRTVEAVAWRMRKGAVRRPVPSEPGPWWKAARLHIRWSRTGVWEQLLAALRDAGRPDLGDVFLDGSNVRVRREAARAEGGHRPAPSAARAGDGARRPVRPVTHAAARSPSG